MSPHTVTQQRRQDDESLTDVHIRQNKAMLFHLPLKVTSHLVDYLRSIPLGIVDRMVAKIHEVRCWFVYPSILSEIHYSNPDDNNLPWICRNPQQFANDGILRVLARRNIGGRRTEFSFASGDRYIPRDRITPTVVPADSASIEQHPQSKSTGKSPPKKEEVADVTDLKSERTLGENDPSLHGAAVGQGDSILSWLGW